MNKIVIEAGKLPASVFFFSDVHIGNAGADYTALAKAVGIITQEAKEHNVIVVGLGDYIDAITLDDKRFNPAEASDEFPLHDLPRAQMRRFWELTAPAWLAARHSIALVGNHEEKFIIKKNFDVFDYLINDLSGGKILNGGYESIIRLLFDGHGTARYVYDLYCTHGAGAGGWREGAALNYIYDLSRYYQADCYVMGHLHRLIAKTSAHLYLNQRHELHEKLKHYGVSGSFLLRHTEGHRSYMEGRRGEPTLLGLLKLSLLLDENSRLRSRFEEIIIE